MDEQMAFVWPVTMVVMLLISFLSLHSSKATFRILARFGEVRSQL